MPELKVGEKAPDFTLQNDGGQKVKLSDLKGKKVVLYFYPKDDTPGCTTEACSFRDEHSNFQKKGAVVIGVTPDDAKSHTKFIEKFSLPFTLIADEGHKIAEEYGVWVEK